MLRSLTLALFGLLVALGTTPAALAHDQLLDTRPADGDSVDAPPSELVLAFTSEILPLAPEVVLTDSAGTTVLATQPAVTGSRATVELPSKLGPETYTVAWRVVSEDGHPIEGTFTFSVTGEAASAEAPATPTPAATLAPDEVTSPAGFSFLTAVLAVGVVGGAGGAAVLLLRRRRVDPPR